VDRQERFMSCVKVVRAWQDGCGSRPHERQCGFHRKLDPRLLACRHGRGWRMGVEVGAITGVGSGVSPSGSRLCLEVS